MNRPVRNETEPFSGGDVDGNLEVGILQLDERPGSCPSSERRTEEAVSILKGVCCTNSLKGERSIMGLQPPDAFSIRKRQL